MLTPCDAEWLDSSALVCYAAYCAVCGQSNRNQETACLSCGQRTAWDSAAEMERYIGRMIGEARAARLREIGRVVLGALVLLGFILLLYWGLIRTELSGLFPSWWIMVGILLGGVWLSRSGLRQLTLARNISKFAAGHRSDPRTAV
jgi:hypothetical protein